MRISSHLTDLYGACAAVMPIRYINCGYFFKAFLDFFNNRFLRNHPDTVRDSILGYEIINRLFLFLGCYDFLHTTDLYPCIDKEFDPVHDDYLPDAPDESSNPDESIFENIYTYEADGDEEGEAWLLFGAVVGVFEHGGVFEEEQVVVGGVDSVGVGDAFGL